MIGRTVPMLMGGGGPRELMQATSGMCLAHGARGGRQGVMQADSGMCWRHGRVAMKGLSFRDGSARAGTLDFILPLHWRSMTHPLLCPATSVLDFSPLFRSSVSWFRILHDSTRGRTLDFIPPLHSCSLNHPLLCPATSVLVSSFRPSIGVQRTIPSFVLRPACWTCHLSLEPVLVNRVSRATVTPESLHPALWREGAISADLCSSLLCGSYSQ